MKTTHHAPWLRNALAAAMLLTCAQSQAGESAFGWLQTLDLQPKGSWEFEQKADITHRQSSGSYNLGLYRSELEYGLTNNLQVSAYLNAYAINSNNNYINPETCDSTPRCTAGFGVPGNRNPTDAYNHNGIDGASAELIWRITNPVTSPVGVGLYIEPTLGHLEDELETRLILQSNFLDDRLIVAVNFLSELEKEKYDTEVIRNSMADILYGVSYRFAPSWTAGIEGRRHTDFDGYIYNSHSQTAHFIGPTLHYAARQWWVTGTWRHQLSGHCFNDGTADCWNGYVSDNHGRDQFMLKVGIPFGTH